jgi:protein O-mannosyl-transferase
MNKKYKIIVIVFLIAASCAAFGRIAANGFINLDDNAYMTENYHIQQGINPESLKWAATAVVASNWHPLTLISHMLDWNLFGANASGHHLVSLLLHIGAVIFLFLFLNKTTNNLWPSAFAAALFALHPLRVESVAWAAERKDVLSMFFGMACIYAYAFYVERSKLTLYFLSLILFILALMSKPMLVTLPFILMLLDYWPLGRWQKATNEQDKYFNSAGPLIWEKIPFFCLTIVFSIVTFWTQGKSDSVPMADPPLLMRSANAIISYVAYLGKIFWPVNLAAFYPYEYFLTLWKILVSILILTGITVVVLCFIKKSPFLFVGWFWYLGTLVPVIGLVQVGDQAMAERYTYLPSIGIAIMLVWVISSLIKSDNIRKKILFPGAIAILAVLTVLTWKQCGYWKNSFGIWNHALSVTKNNHLAHNSRGIVYGEIGEYQLAIDDFNKAIDINPVYFRAYNNRGFAYAKLGQYQHAVEDYSEAIRLKPDYVRAYNNRAIAYFRHGNKGLGCYDAQKACELGNCEMWKSEGRKYCR